MLQSWGLVNNKLLVRFYGELDINTHLSTDFYFILLIKGDVTFRRF